MFPSIILGIVRWFLARYPAGYSIIARTGYTETRSYEAAIQSWLDCARWCRSRRRRDGVSSLTRGTAIVCGLVLPVRPIAFYAKGPVCRYCHTARGRNLSITSLRHSTPDASLRKLGKRLARLMDSYLARTRRDGGGGALCMHIMREGCKRPEMRPGNNIHSGRARKM